MVVAVAAALAAWPHAGARATAAPGGLRGLLHTHSADTAGRGVLDVGLYSAFHTRTDAEDSRHLFFIQQVHVAYGLSPFLEAGVMLPVRLWTVNTSTTSTIAPTNHGGFGDLEAAAKLQLPLPWQRLRFGARARLRAPTGSRSRGFSTETTDFAAGGLVTLDLGDLERFPPTRVHLNGTWRWNRNERFGFGQAPLTDIERGGFWPPAYPRVPPGETESWNDELALRAGVEFSTRVLDLFTEFSADLFPNIGGLDFTDQPVFLTQGAGLKFRNGMNVRAGVDFSLQNDAPDARLAEMPEYRLWLGLTWQLELSLGDGDHDGIPEDQDACPDEPEDFDGFEDDDGCPDLDNDGDGIPDRDDLAPDLAEDLDGFEDADGRPDLDNDGDGIQDDEDDCPDQAEDFDGDRDTDGCPDLERDSDGDGVNDARDRCPEAAEDRDGFEDDDGCPDPDNDGDGVPDERDACPQAAETLNGFEDDDGCPDTPPGAPQLVLEDLTFASGSAALPAEATERLAPLVAMLREQPDLRIELRGFTDDRGPAAANLDLSMRRAEAVRDYLVAQGIEAQRVRVRGFGEANPRDTNATPEGRARNRRIEVWRLP